MSEDIKVPRLSHAATHFVERHKGWALALGVVLLGVTGAGLPRLQADFSYRAFFEASDPLIQDIDEFERRFGNDDTVILALHSPSGIFDEESIKLLQQLTREMWLVPDVIRVDSLSNFNWVHNAGDDLLVEPLLPEDAPLTPEFLEERKAVALGHEQIPNWLLSKDARTAVVFATLKPGIGKPLDYVETMKAVHQLVPRFETADHRLMVTGQAALTEAFREVAEKDGTRIVPVVFVIILVLVGLLVRSIVAVVLQTLVVALSIVSTLGIAGWLGYPITNLTVIIPQVLLVIGVADAVHILVSMRLGLVAGLDKRSALRAALLKNFMPTFVTSATTAIGFFAFLGAPLRVLEAFGVLAGIGSLVAWLFVWLLAVPLLYLLPASRVSARELQQRSDLARATLIAEWLQRRRRAILVTCATLTLACAGLASLNQVNSDPFKYFVEGYPVRAANEFLDTALGATRGVELVVEAGAEDGMKDPAFLRKVEQYQAWIESLPEVTRTLSIVDILKHTNRALNAGRQDAYRLPEDRDAIAQQLLVYTLGLPRGMDLNDRVPARNDAVRITVHWNIIRAAETMDMVARVESRGRELGLNVKATGKNMLWQSMNGRVTHSLLSSLLISVLGIGAVLAFFVRSLKLGIIGMIPNVVPVVIGAGLFPLTGRDLDFGTVMVASVVLGITVDDTVHVLENYRVLRNSGRSGLEAVKNILMEVGPALFVTTGVLVCGFGALGFASFIPNVYFGLLTAILLLLALAVDMTVTLAILATDKPLTKKLEAS